NVNWSSIGSLPLPRNRGLPRLRIIIERKSGRPDLRWERSDRIEDAIRVRGLSQRVNSWREPLIRRASRATFSHKGGRKDGLRTNRFSIRSWNIRVIGQ